MRLLSKVLGEEPSGATVAVPIDARIWSENQNVSFYRAIELTKKRPLRRTRQHTALASIFFNLTGGGTDEKKE
ncbi:hypothetical protein P343_16530 [Sporolactobacillus laevolacticus DSM 442]|uniref:Uncharacterized protein n=1 Tax=Sporolactobacillus laevolacticus DSM 442 TaxID=1395513 RepID=V6IUC7_9BACL|nr:hypothetical protein P343_16530 [Sporolactobacillus laevolacticus DSM 442]